MSLVIDADGHFMEPFDLWEQYLEPQYRERAIRLVRDKGTGEETIFVAGKKSRVMTDPSLLKLTIGAGQLERMADPSFTYKDGPAGAYDAQARVKLMDEQGIDKSLVYPTLGLVWECEVGMEDADLAAAYCRAYNNWIIDHCQPYGQRLFPIAHISLLDTQEAVKELRRVAKLGVRGVFVSAVPYRGVTYGDPSYTAFWTEAQEIGMPVGIHPVFHLGFVGHHYYKEPSLWMFITMFSEDVKLCFTTLFNDGFFDLYPRLKVVLVEGMSGWIAQWLERLDHKYLYLNHTLPRPLRARPSEYFRRQCWISADPDEKTLPTMMRLVGEDKFVWGSDFPHAEGYAYPVVELKEAIEGLPEGMQQKILGENAARLYNLS
jgi:predicted TIM-barrel fold metal-dependent hydrolase